MLVAHGRGEHGGRYSRFAGDLTPRGFACAAFDFRGFGQADGPRGHLRRFDDYLADLDQAVEAAAELAAGIPLVLLGHSMGGLAAIRWAQTRGAPERLAGLVLSSPFLKMPTPLSPAARAVVGLLSVVAPKKRFSGSGKPATRDEAVLEANQADPLQVHQSTARWVSEMLKTHALVGDPGHPGVPVLTLQGGADQSTDPAASRAFTEALSDATYREYPGLLHEVLNETEPDRGEVIADLTAWLEQVVRP